MEPSYERMELLAVSGDGLAQFNPFLNRTITMQGKTID
jgi:hypothetical protein